MIHTIRLGTHAEKDYLLRAAAWYDELLVNANLLEGTTGATSVFILELAQHQKNFFVDPVTYAFALDPVHIMSRSTRGETRFKRTFLNLARRYGLIAPDADFIPQIKPATLQNDSPFRLNFVQAVLRYQQTTVSESLDANMDFLSDQTQPVPPSKLIAPYFFVPFDEDGGWAELNCLLVREAAECSQSEYARGVFALICFDSLMLDRGFAIDKLVTLYSQLPCEGFALWPTSFNEQRATAGQVAGLAQLVSSLALSGRPIISMYGGYFSAALASLGLTGISHGVGYGEQRDVVPVVGGGLPPAKYYLPDIHEEVYIHDLVSLARDLDETQFQQTICRCVICRGLLQGGVNGLLDQYGEIVRRPYGNSFKDFAAPTVYRLTRFHFMQNRSRELRELPARNRAEIAAQLIDAYNRFAGPLGSNRVTFLRTWASALSEL